MQLNLWNHAIKFEKYDNGIFPLYEDNPWILYKEKISIFDIIDKKKECFKKLG